LNKYLDMVTQGRRVPSGWMWNCLMVQKCITT